MLHVVVGALKGNVRREQRLVSGFEGLVFRDQVINDAVWRRGCEHERVDESWNHWCSSSYLSRGLGMSRQTGWATSAAFVSPSAPARLLQIMRAVEMEESLGDLSLLLSPHALSGDTKNVRET